MFTSKTKTTMRRSGMITRPARELWTPVVGSLSLSDIDSVLFLASQQKYGLLGGFNTLYRRFSFPRQYIHATPKLAGGKRLTIAPAPVENALQDLVPVWTPTA